MLPSELNNIKLPFCGLVFSLILTACGGSAGLESEKTSISSSIKAQNAEAPIVSSVSPTQDSSEESSPDSLAVSSTTQSNASSVITESSSSKTSSATVSISNSRASSSGIVVVASSSKSVSNLSSISPVNSSSSVKSSSPASSSLASSLSSKLSSAASSSLVKSSSSKSSSSLVASSSSKAPSSSSKASSSSVASTTTSALIEWAHPIARANGDYLNLDEIGGYDIRYKSSSSSTYTHVDIKGNSTTSYKFTGSLSDLTLEIAVYDTSDVYSEYVTIN